MDLQKSGRDTRSVVVLFGLGVVGGSIREHLLLNGFRPLYAPLMHWGNKESFQDDLRLLDDRLTDLAHHESAATKLRIVWAAGKAGFSASEDDTVGEWINYEQTLSMFTTQWVPRFPQGASFFLVSSAGGLFEGQRNVGDRSQPSPMRPYGFLKLRQEKLLQDAPPAFQRYIYRLSSVYGYIEPSKRMGLVPTLLLNGIRYGVSRVLGNISTLRDYISSDDVGKFICGEVLSADPVASGRPVFLAAGKPTSISEVKVLIERMIGRKLYISYDYNQTNFLDITFSSGALPERWQSVDLGVGINRVYARYLTALN